MFNPHNLHTDARELQQLMEAAHAGDASPANIGRQLLLKTKPRAGSSNVDIEDTQLITMRVDKPQQWIVTMRQPTTPNGAQPWANSFDGGTFDASSVFGAPAIPEAGGGTLRTALQCTVRWGAGGVSFYTRFDYPMMGGVFGLVADTFDLNVFVNVPSTQDGIPPDQVPLVGAFMVPGVAQDKHPLRWLEQKATIGAGDTAWWGLKPYAKKMHVVMPLATKATVQFASRNGAGGGIVGLTSRTFVESPAGSGIDEVIDVPAASELVAVTNGGGVGSLAFVEWWMGLV